jgi:hypothetical protein
MAQDEKKGWDDRTHHPPSQKRRGGAFLLVLTNLKTEHTIWFNTKEEI